MKPHLVTSALSALFAVKRPNSFESALQDMDHHDLASGISIGGYHTDKSLDNISKNTNEVAADINLGRQMMYEGGMMNSIPDMMKGSR